MLFFRVDVRSAVCHRATWRSGEVLGNFLLTVTPGATRRQVGGFLSHGATPRSHPIFVGNFPWRCCPTFLGENFQEIKTNHAGFWSRNYGTQVNNEDIYSGIYNQCWGSNLCVPFREFLEMGASQKSFGVLLSGSPGNHELPIIYQLLIWLYFTYHIHHTISYHHTCQLYHSSLGKLWLYCKFFFCREMVQMLPIFHFFGMTEKII